MHTEVLIKRCYDTITEDGMRILVDRLWPRGIKKEDLKCDIWAKDIAPSPELRKMFHADPDAHWDLFAKSYEQELDTSSAFADLMSKIKKEKPARIILLYAFKNTTKNHAVLLQQKMMAMLKQ